MTLGAIELKHDQPFVLQQRVPESVAEFKRRGMALPPAIDRVCDRKS